jgi:hypothetical protein
MPLSSPHPSVVLSVRVHLIFALAVPLRQPPNAHVLNSDDVQCSTLNSVLPTCGSSCHCSLAAPAATLFFQRIRWYCLRMSSAPQSTVLAALVLAPSRFILATLSQQPANTTAPPTDEGQLMDGLGSKREEVIYCTHRFLQNFTIVEINNCSRQRLRQQTYPITYYYCMYTIYYSLFIFLCLDSTLIARTSF